MRRGGGGRGTHSVDKEHGLLRILKAHERLSRMHELLEDEPGSSSLLENFQRAYDLMWQRWRIRGGGAGQTPLAILFRRYAGTAVEPASQTVADERQQVARILLEEARACRGIADEVELPEVRDRLIEMADQCAGQAKSLLARVGPTHSTLSEIEPPT